MELITWTKLQAHLWNWCNAFCLPWSESANQAVNIWRYEQPAFIFVIIGTCPPPMLIFGRTLFCRRLPVVESKLFAKHLISAWSELWRGFIAELCEKSTIKWHKVVSKLGVNKPNCAVLPWAGVRIAAFRFKNELITIWHGTGTLCCGVGRFSESVETRTF